MNISNKNRYNGWANYKTWLCVVNLDNVESNYNYIKNNAKELLKLNGKDLKQNLKENCFFYDRMNWQKVSFRDLKNYLKEFIIKF